MKKITPSDYPDLLKYFKHQKYDHCAYSLASVIAWTNHLYQPYAVTDNGSLIVCAEFYGKHKKSRHLILPISPVREYNPEELHKVAVRLGFDKYWYIPGEYIEKYGQTRVESFFRVKEQPGFDDYVYNTEDLAKLKGNKYSKKRNLISQFKKAYVNKNRVKLEEITTSNASECIDFLEKWCEERNCDKEPDEILSCEKSAATNAIENTEILKMKGLLLRIDDTVSAFGISSYLTDNMSALHFQKAFANEKGLYQYFDNMCAMHLSDGYKYINKESDMGIPGLAKTKKSYHPVKMVKSYELKISEK
ncbi:MAG: DUF2156 domain-containing protein [Desulfobacterales bacterium]|nr:DUF2156 domain-containing protein [Desulfobacterales bacterium]